MSCIQYSHEADLHSGTGDNSLHCRQPYSGKKTCPSNSEDMPTRYNVHKFHKYTELMYRKTARGFPSVYIPLQLLKATTSLHPCTTALMILKRSKCTLRKLLISFSCLSCHLEAASQREYSKNHSYNKKKAEIFYVRQPMFYPYHVGADLDMC